jgi:Transglutaminase-like superfamily/Coenzyme PQQ synthesis protein D (PqqD)
VVPTSKITEIIDSGWGGAHGEFKLPSSVFFVAAPDDSGRLFDLEGSFHSVDAVGAQMLLHALREDRETTAISLARRYGVDAERIREDYDAFFEDLERRKLVYPRGAGPPDVTRFRGSAMLLQPLLTLICRLPLRWQAWALLALARVSIRIFGWDETRRAWVDHAGPAAGLRGTTQQAIGDAVRHAAARHLLGVSCKERSLCCFALCRTARIPASVVLGVSLFPLASHCWCETATGCLTDFPDRCEGFTSVLRYM